MRPIHLTVEGLACFREKQEIDFRRLELFAISGPTGAGKSTLLDAMIFALYGEIPRVNLQSRTEMISAARDRAAVVLDFEVGDSRYRIARTLRRNGVQMVRLEQRDGDGAFQGLADQVRTAADRVVQILGLGASAFMQAVVLPQGEFSSFLKAQPRDRRGMLRTLLRLDVYERMRERAQRLAALGKGTVDALQKLLSDEYGIDPAALARLEAEHARIVESLAVSRRRRDETQAALVRARGLHTRTRELRQVEARQAAWRQEAKAVRLAQARIEAAARATPLLPLLAEAAHAFAAARTAKQAADEAQARSDAARRDWQAKQGALAAAAKAGRTIKQLRTRVARLHRVAGRLPELEQLAAALARQQQGLAALAGERTALARRISQARAAQAQQGAAGEAALRVAEASGYDPELDELLQRERDRAVELGAARRVAAEQKAELTRKRQAAAQHAGEVERLAKRAASARRSAAKAQRACATAEEALHHAISLNEANHLRERLLPGRPCPVCEQIVATPPPVQLVPAVEAARAAVVAGREEQAAADALARQSEAAQTREQAMLDAAGQGLADLAARHAELRAGVAAAEAAIRRALGKRAPQGGGAIEAWIERQIVALGKRRQAHDEAQAQRASAERALEAARTAEAEARERLGEKDASLARLEEERDASRGRLRALAAQVRAVTRAADPAAEAAALEEQVLRIEGALKAAAAEEAASRNRLAAAEEARRLTARAALSAAKHALKRVESRDARIVRAGFADEAGVRAALLDEAVAGRLAEQVQRHLREGHAVEERRAALAAELGSERVSDRQLEQIAKRAAATAALVDAALGREKQLEEQVGRLRERLERGRELGETLSSEQAALRVHNLLAGDLRSDGFQAFLLHEVFTELVRGASARLLTLTGERYSLRFDDEEIRVVDHDNADETRISDTLSGGETFLTSLALALELSDQVQRAVGAVNLDSLFIDEGFGTLDPDTLALASETLQSLRVGGRMVGVITHIPELRDEFAQQVIVIKHQGFSTVEVSGLAEPA